MRALAALALLWFVSGCATLHRGTKEMVRIESEPAGATVILSNGMAGVTPASFELPRKHSIGVEIRKEGYRTQFAAIGPIEARRRFIAFGPIGLVGKMIGRTIDDSTGASQDLIPNPLVVKLKLLEPPKGPAEPTKTPEPANTLAAPPEAAGDRARRVPASS